MSLPLLPPPPPVDTSRRDAGTRWVSYLTVGTISAAVVTGSVLVVGMQAEQSSATATSSTEQAAAQSDQDNSYALQPPANVPQSVPDFQTPDQSVPQYQAPAQQAPVYQAPNGNLGNGPSTSGS
jgi:hypothetical protein